MDLTFEQDGALAERFPSVLAAQGKISRSLLQYVTDRPGHDRRYTINADKICAERGCRPEETLETGLDKTMSWYLGHEFWWKNVMDGTYSRANYRSIWGKQVV